ncbi:unnamed protein product [Darwinula stevensoni]|uniref:Uncharacterized protein n=1 Tax=Darwinula stevensoni TaxID=69355 RepID=A0A7R9FR03_9CRUS|nr:unnamed protein product [Darwinula stevensoni]CAG0900735.1 unnamed protein product [Darwinula stevensoni]
MRKVDRDPSTPTERKGWVEADIQFEDEGGEIAGVIPVTERFLGRWTGHGLTRVAYKDSSWFRKLCWLLLFLAAAAYLVVEAMEAINLYLQYQKATSITLDQKKSIAFPAVTVCPYGPLRKDLTDDSTLTRFKNLFRLNDDLRTAIGQSAPLDSSCSRAGNGSSPASNDTACSVGNAGTATSCVKPFAYLNHGTVEINGTTYRTDDYPSMLLLTNLALEDFRSFLALADDSGIISPSALVPDCTFGGAPCGPEDLQWVTDPYYGKCVSFNYRGNKTTERAGLLHGLHLRLSWNGSDPLTLLSPAEGFRLVLHDPQLPPDPTTEGLDAAPRKNSHVAVRKTQVNRLPPENGGSCSPDSYLGDRFNGLFTKSNETKYSEKLCLELCKIEKILNETKCYYKSPLLQDLWNSSNYCNESKRMIHDDPPPPPSKGAFRAVQKPQRFDASVDQPPCGCSIPCSQNRYFWSLSSVDLIPENEMLSDLVDWLKKQKGLGLDESQLENKTFCLRRGKLENAAVVNVYYETMIVETYGESPGLTWLVFVGVLGGWMGLFVGMSCMSLFEVLEYVVDFLLYAWRAPRRDKMGPRRRAVLTREDAFLIPIVALILA